MWIGSVKIGELYADICDVDDAGIHYDDVNSSSDMVKENLS